MPVDSLHPQYTAISDDWAQMRDVVAGEKRVHDRGESYLPKLGGQDAAEYGAYVRRAGFYNATQRTVDGLSGMVFRKAPVLEVPTSIEEWLEDVDLAGSSLTTFAESVLEENLVVSRAGVLVDHPPARENTTRAQAERENQRPFWTLYQAENITGWKHGKVNNRAQLTQVRLYEQVEVESQDDPFATEEVEQYRVLDIVTEDDEGNPVQPFYRQQLWRKVGSNWEVIEEVVPQMRGAPLDYIPFIFVGPRGTGWSVNKPVLLDLANTNLSHYRTVADLEHGAHFTALPTPYVFGVHENDIPDAIGPTEIWGSTATDVTVGLLEFTGQGLEALEKRRETKEGHMAALGARMLAPEKRDAEAAETVALRHSGEMSMLASLANATSQALTQALMIARDWFGVSGDVKVELNTDFMPQPMSPEMLNALMKSWQGGGMAFEDLHWNLKRGEVIREDRSAEDVQGDAQDEAPAMPQTSGNMTE